LSNLRQKYLAGERRVVVHLERPNRLDAALAEVEAPKPVGKSLRKYPGRPDKTEVGKFIDIA
jgi:hypothetical protein